MKMSKTKKYILAAAMCVIIPVSLYYGIGYLMLYLKFKLAPPAFTQSTAQSLQPFMLKYIQDNNGLFPQNEQDMIDSGFMKRDQNDIYFRDPTWTEGATELFWHRKDNYYFDMLEIAYEMDINDIERLGEKLIDKKTGEQVFLIKGPFTELLSPRPETTYTRFSLELYELMLEERNEQERLDK